MRIEQHVDNCIELFGVGGDEIHHWIDAFFDMKRYQAYLRHPQFHRRFNPYEHRKHRHHIETIAEAQDVFKEIYTPEMVEKIYIQHLKDDYKGYVPCKADFEDPEFLRKYHRFG